MNSTPAVHSHEWIHPNSANDCASNNTSLGCIDGETVCQDRHSGRTEFLGCGADGVGVGWAGGAGHPTHGGGAGIGVGTGRQEGGRGTRGGGVKGESVWHSQT